MCALCSTCTYSSVRHRITPYLRHIARSRLCRPLSEWDTDTVVAWFHEMGLSAYTAEARRWVRSGSHLLRATPAELEKELGLKVSKHHTTGVLPFTVVGCRKS